MYQGSCLDSLQWEIKLMINDNNRKWIEGSKKVGAVIGAVLRVSAVGTIKYSKMLFKIIQESKK